jgi:hypothetical protein
MHAFCLTVYTSELMSLGRPRSRRVDNIKMGLGEIEWSHVDGTGVAQGRYKLRALAKAVMKLRVL